jgi:hypothetical protein
MKQLVLIIAIRKTVSGTEEPPVKEILTTNIMQVITQIFSFADTNEEIRLMKVSIITGLNLSVNS